MLKKTAKVMVVVMIILIGVLNCLLTIDIARHIYAHNLTNQHAMAISNAYGKNEVTEIDVIDVDTDPNSMRSEVVFRFKDDSVAYVHFTFDGEGNLMTREFE